MGYTHYCRQSRSVPRTWQEWSAGLQRENERLRRPIRLYGSFSPLDPYEDHVRRFCELVWERFGHTAVPPETFEPIATTSFHR